MSLSLVKNIFKLLSGGVEISRSLLNDLILRQMFSVSPRMYLIAVAFVVVGEVSDWLFVGVHSLFLYSQMSFWMRVFGKRFLRSKSNAILRFSGSGLSDEKVYTLFIRPTAVLIFRAVEWLERKFRMRPEAQGFW